MHPNAIARDIVDAALKVHRHFGPGLLESVYEASLAAELTTRGFDVLRQHPIFLDTGQKAFLADLIIANSVIIEIKSVDTINPFHKKQLLTYLRLANLNLGLLINFNVALIKQGITRIVNNLE